MSREDSDIVAVRDLPPGRPEPTDESVHRTWHRITEARREARPRTPSRILVPVMAATIVAGLVVGGALVFRPGAEQLGVGTPSDDKTSEPNLTPAPPETVAALNALADAATRAALPPPQVKPGQLIFVRHDGWAASFHIGVGAAPEEANPPKPASTERPEAGGSATAELEEGRIEEQIRELWFDPEGMVTLSITDGRTDMGVDPDTERGVFEQSGPSLDQPTPAWLASLPTDPDQLRGKLRELMGEEEAWSTDHALWSTLQEFYLRTDLLLTPELRSALLRSFTGLLGLTSSEAMVDGRRLVAVRHTERESGDEILFDPATGAAVGRRSVTSSPDVTVSAPAGTPRLDPGVTYQATWTQKIVTSVGAR